MTHTQFILQAMMGFPFLLIIAGAITFIGSYAVIKLYRLFKYFYNKSKNISIKGQRYFMQDVIVSFLLSFIICVFLLYLIFANDHFIN